MSPKERVPSPTIQMPQTGVPVTCPHCGHVNKVTAYLLLKGFRCESCGEKINGTASGKTSPDNLCPIKEIVCPKCKNGTNLEHLSGNEEGKRFRCKTCGTEW